VSALRQRFDELRRSGRKGFVPFLPLGYPSLTGTSRLIDALERAGADALELGMPFSDSLADGPVIQAAYHAALAAGLEVDELLSFVGRERRQRELPVVLMCCYNLVHRIGLDRFAARCAAEGIDGLIVPDLPIEESAPLAGELARRDVALVNLVSPTTPARRAARIARASSGFVYYISRRGVTGMRELLDADVEATVLDLKRHSRLPVLVGFGISTPEHASAVARVADGVIVGSALVSAIARHHRGGYVEAVARLARQFRRAVDRGGASRRRGRRRSDAA
jgi:tryptophan synthase alpha chain